MALGMAELIILGLLVDYLFRKMRMPGLVGMMLVGVVLGPCLLGLLNPNLLKISSDLRMIALIVILLRAGFELRLDTLKRVGGRAALLSCVPAIFEGLGVTIAGPALLGLTWLESAILGAVLGAVSPAVLVPLMIRFTERRKGTEKGIPTLILAAASVDDVFVIVVFTVLLGFLTGSQANIAWELAGIPLSVALGIAGGGFCGIILHRLFSRFNPRATKRLLAILGVSIFLVALERRLEEYVPFAALVAVMAIGAIILERSEYMAREISVKLASLWVFSEILLFTLVGAQVDLGVAWHAGLAGVLVILIGLATRSVGTYLCLLGSRLTTAERLFVVVSYLPKATVQAAIGGAPLLAMQAAGMDTRPGQIILAVAVLSIPLTAPTGAWAISIIGERVLKEKKMAGPGMESKEMTPEVMGAIMRVSEVMNADIPTVRETQTLTRVFQAFSESESEICAVMGKGDALSGIIFLGDLRPILSGREAWDIVIARDVYQPLKAAVIPDMSIKDALDAMEKEGLAQIPVIDGRTGRPVGLLDKTRALKRINEACIGRLQDALRDPVRM